MLSRRVLIGQGILWPLLGSRAAPAASAAAAARAAPELWILDRTMPNAAAVSAAAHAAHFSRAEVHEFSADPGSVWMKVLAPRLSAAALAIGGYTNASALFCLHYLARDFGMTLAAMADGMGRLERVVHEPGALIDLREPRFSDRGRAYTWLMLPRSA